MSHALRQIYKTAPCWMPFFFEHVAAEMSESHTGHVKARLGEAVDKVMAGVESQVVVLAKSSKAFSRV
jgi:hypothetical protein